LLCLDAAALPVRTASLDAVTFHSVLYLLSDQSATLREAARVLRPGGRAVLLEPQAGPRATLFGLARALPSLRWAVTAALWRAMKSLGWRRTRWRRSAIGWSASPETMIATRSLSSRTACTRSTSRLARCPTDSPRSTRVARCAGR